MADIMLSADGAHVRMRGRKLIGPVDLMLGPSGTTVMIGPNGAGKTTLLKTLYGMQRLAAGTITWHQACERSFVFQSPVMLRRTVQDNIAYPLQLAGIRRHQARQQAATWAEKVGLADRLQSAANALSGGERQKLAIARALSPRPGVVFLDEPCAFLDGRATREIEALLQDAAGAGTRLIMSTHDLGQARRLANDIVFVQGGQVREQGPAGAFFAGPDTAAAQAFVRGDIVE